jgi:hypothetical protein
VSEITTKPAIGSMRLGSLFLNIADADDHRPANHLIGRAGGEQRLELGHVGRMFADPHRPCLGLQNHGRPVMLFGAQFVRRGGDDGEAANSFARRRAPGSPQPGHAHQPAIGQCDCVRLLARRVLLPLEKLSR